MSVKEQYWKYSLITIILGLGLILFIKMSPFMGGILGACTIYIMVRKQMFYLTQEKHFKKSITAILLLIEFMIRLFFVYNKLTQFSPIPLKTGHNHV